MARTIDASEMKEIFGSLAYVSQLIDEGKLARPLPRGTNQQKRRWLSTDVDAAFAALVEERKRLASRGSEVTLRASVARRVRESGRAPKNL